MTSAIVSSTSASPTVQTLTLDITGMKCAGCVKAVERKLAQQPGVQSACVNLVTEVATVTCEPETDPEGLAQVLPQILTQSGFPSQVRQSNSPSLQAGLADLANLRQAQAQRQRRDLIVAIGLLLVSTIGHVSQTIGIAIPGLGNDGFHAGLAAAALLVPGRALVWDGLKSLWHGAPTMNTLIGLGALTAFLTSLVALINPTLGWECFFDEPVMLIGFILLGRTLEQQARHRAAASFQSLLALQPRIARLVKVQGFSPSQDQRDQPQTPTIAPGAIEVPVEHLRVGEWVQVLPGEQVPIDGEILLGESTIDESMLTGESVPVVKRIGDSVSAGTLNQSGAIVLQVTHTGENTTLARIIQLVETAQTRKAPIQQLADTVAGYFTYGVMALAGLTFLFWFFLGLHWWPEVLNYGGQMSHQMSHQMPHPLPLPEALAPASTLPSHPLSPLLLSLKLTIAVLVIACPCALGLATPTALLVGSSLGAENGLLIRGGDVLERVRTLDTIVFDKTGTVTQGQPTVTDIIVAPQLAQPYTTDQLLQMAASVEQGTTHPLATAIVQTAKNQGLDLLSASEFRTQAGAGVIAQVDLAGRRSCVLLGNADWLNQHQVTLPPDAHAQAATVAHQGKTIVHMAIEQQWVGLFGIQDPLRPDAQDSLQTLQREGLRVMLLTGDRRETAQAVAQALGLASDQVIAEVKPEEKSHAIAALQAQGYRVGMVGDGINDAPALAQADVGIALQSGTEVAAETASLVLMRDRLSDVVLALHLSRQILGTIRQNLVWAFGYNAVSIPIAAGVFLPQFRILLSPGSAGFLMALSSISVVLNSLLLRWHFNRISIESPIRQSKPSLPN
ncbi:copper-translocating P-type ATPase [Alkalinema sp. FACHB-956]|nr:heavy metal translocating P-type ATPase [Alkalinema sp. FACHB-956]MBD2329825.1 copper-translocating P-type ATPase [Alkalinema sp. FACHB-956]